MFHLTLGYRRQNEEIRLGEYQRTGKLWKRLGCA
jgi:hypothetical protein